MRIETTRGRAALLALFAVLAAWTWMTLTVHYNFGGNWSALFCIRPGMPVPEFLKSENLYTARSTEGYDGQVYHLIAHDPWMRKGSADAIADAPFRYQRIFIPALAWMLAFGQDQWIHASYFAVILVCVFAGVYWSARFAECLGRSPTWGLVFLLAPAAIVSIDRLTVDIALAAFAVGFALYASESSDLFNWKIAVILVGAALTRETALPIIAGYAIYLASRKRFAHAVLGAATAVPAIAWYLWLSRLGRSSATDYVHWIPFAGFAERILHPAHYALSPFKNSIAMTLDYLALAGIALAFVYAIRFAASRRWDSVSAAVYALAIAAALIGSRSVWEEAYAFARVLTPLLLLVAFQSLQSRSPKSPGFKSTGWFEPQWWAFAPMLLADLPIPLALWQQVQGVAHGIVSTLTGARP
jgi:hypothetical protein